MIGQVHWHEGLFLQPHHLQTMQQHLLTRIAGERRLGWSYAYGLVDARLSSDTLEKMLIEFDRLRVIMPSGIEVNVPENADIPPLDIEKQFKASTGALTVSLGVPLWHATRANTIELGSDDWRPKLLYRVTEVERPDENTGENAQPLSVRRVNARLLLDGDDRTDMEVLPLLKVVHGTGEQSGTPRLEKSFIPPCLVVGGWPTLREVLRDLSNQIEASRKELVIQLTRGGFSVDTMRGVQFEQMLRLKTLNRFAARLPHLVSAPGISPFVMYLELRELLGELAALHPERDQFQVGNYDHDDPAPVFHEMSKRIRDLLKGSVAATYLQVPFTREGKALVAELSEDHVAAPNDYFLGIRTREDRQALARLVEDRDKFKLMAYSFRGKKVFGIELQEERVAAVELPAETGLHYFRLLRDQSARMWERIVQERKMVIEWLDSESSDFAITLYMTVPNRGL